MNAIFDQFLDLYRSFSLDSLGQIGEVYAEQIVFQDPLVRVEGREALQGYFKHGMQGLQYCRFEFGRQVRDAEHASVEWTMHFQHRRIHAGKTCQLDGITLIQFGVDGKIIFHRDYYDMGQLIYERVPLIGRVIGWIKNKARPSDTVVLS